MAMKMARLIQGLLCLMLESPAWSGIAMTPKIYLAGIHDADWTFSGSKSSCELRHEIPGFGIGRFQRLAGEDPTEEPEAGVVQVIEEHKAELQHA